MANALYDLGRQAFLMGDLAWDTGDIRIVLRDEGVDVPDLALDDMLDDILAGARVAVSTSLTGKTGTNGVADADDKTITAVSGATVESLDLYDHTGVESTSRLICNIDTATGLPLTPNSNDVIVRFDNGANRIFKL